MSDLLSCPFCGSSRVEIVGYFPFVRCKGCGAETDNYSDEEAAAEAWNTRAERTCKVVNYNRYMFSCSVSLSCGHEVSEVSYFPNYCPVCGAKVVE